MNFLDIAKEEAKKAMSKGEVPIGAVIVKDNIVISKAHNLKETLKDATAHAEILAIREASKFLEDWRLNGTEMYVTLEPCTMCTSAIIQSRISKLHIGTFNKDMGACGSIINLIDDRMLESFLNVNWLYDEECSNLLMKFFNLKRKLNKNKLL
ncbi:nucleoside deaminase [Clostridium botulinum]|uniref:tRNA-specific adenosine deaminase n=1 Tax=Clostridium botulinum TaxID=1491 RepID=A0A6B4JQL8_CLOBO|nr:nucleoside deaminase [Clostridium botulinum]EES47712.1 tRNA-specific adenosine deaminase [Clostridium botulinum E1 str. 'BoNT E Beluga']MBY6762653.1 nucleoside deaminase [Clostridium botulinum]MBY6921438.1 nucleoside deaminase [Clostridium botulinum]MCR1132330.1 nucleoside deaminase [Clostridium botulinum]NFJ59376.1 nucleoside deaminase [Clostridium botulinum]